MLRVMARSGYERPRRNVSDQRDRFSERRVDGFALERKNCEDAFVDAVLPMPEPVMAKNLTQDFDHHLLLSQGSES